MKILKWKKNRKTVKYDRIKTNFSLFYNISFKSLKILFYIYNIFNEN